MMGAGMYKWAALVFVAYLQVYHLAEYTLLWTTTGIYEILTCDRVPCATLTDIENYYKWVDYNNEQKKKGKVK